MTTLEVMCISDIPIFTCAAENVLFIATIENVPMTITDSPPNTPLRNINLSHSKRGKEQS